MKPAKFVLLTIVVLAVAWMLFFRGRDAALSPLPPSEFASVELRLLGEDAAVPRTLRLESGAGLYAELRITPRNDLPSMHEGRTVQPPDQWPLCVIYYPTNYSPIATDFYVGEFHRFKHPKSNLRAVRNPGAHYNWDLAGYQGPPEKPADLTRDEWRYWTFLAPPPDKSGHVVYTVIAYPTAHQEEGGGFRFGKPALLWRGVIEVPDPRVTGS